MIKYSYLSAGGVKEIMIKNNILLKNIKKTWPYIKECKGNLISYAIVSIIEGFLGAALPLFTAKIILNITDALISQLILSAILVLIIQLVLYIVYFFKSFFYQKI